MASTKVGVVGHSDGGTTAAAVAFNTTVGDPRIGAGVILSGALGDFAGTWFPDSAPALLAIHGTDDPINPYANSEALYNQDQTSPKWLVAVQGATHLEPFTTDPVRPQISALIADFLRAQLNRDTTAAGRISTDANVPGALALMGHA